MKLQRPLVLLIVAIVALALSWPVAARAGGCMSGCSNNARVCKMQARTEYVACIHGCSRADFQCRLGCRAAMVASRTTCRTQRLDCVTSCSSPMLSPDSASACTPSCGTDTRTCTIDARMNGVSCIRQCLHAGSNGLGDCLGQCAAELRSGGASCSASFHGCVEGCGGQKSGACFDTITMQCTAQPCSAAQPCTQPNEFCSPRCAPGPSSGECFDTVGMQCTGQSCSSDQACAQPNQVCLPQCPPPTPSGKCFDTAAKQCTDEACSANQPCSGSDEVCTLQCPPPPPSGQCFDVTQRQCTEQKCGEGQPCPAGQRCLSACPLPTPTPQCSGDACGGRCVIAPPCPGGLPCPESEALQQGQCEADATGACSCVPYVPPTPTPQCSGDTCGGPCSISPPCPPGGPCPEFATRLGQCETDATGACGCVASVPPTPTPQCGGDMCGGKCLISPCPPGVECFAPTRLGECAPTASGACQCVPVVPPTPTPTPEGAGGTPTPTPPPPGQCGGDTCGGSCWDPPCPPGVPCPILSVARKGLCEITSSGSCECVPFKSPTPTPQCGGDVCGGPCTVVSPCTDPTTCDRSIALPGQCQPDATGACGCVASVPPTPTPQCGGDVCGGPCTVVSPCAPGEICNGPVALPGQCQPDATGACGCVASVPPTPTPQCGGDVCGGDCTICPPCVPGGPCPLYPCRPGQCQPDATGACGCVASVPPTPTPQCGGDVCGGPCTVGPPCADGQICDNSITLIGECQLDANGVCGCAASVPPTPTPQCGGDVCGGPCSIPPPCAPGQICPDIVSRPGQCETDAAGACECVPYVPPTPTAPPGGTPTPAQCTVGQCVSTLGYGCTGRACGSGLGTCLPNEICDLSAERCPCLKPPQPCTSDADCDDGNACTIDHCTSDGCVHDCVCVGPLACGPGPAGN